MKTTMEQPTTEFHTFQITEIDESFEEAATEAPAVQSAYPREYLVEEPDNYDYIFEPGHYPEPHTLNIAEVPGEVENSTRPKAAVTTEEKYKNGVKFLKRQLPKLSKSTDFDKNNY